MTLQHWFFRLLNKTYRLNLDSQIYDNIVMEKQASLDVVRCNEIGKRIMTGKVKNQCSLTKYFNKLVVSYVR